MAHISRICTMRMPTERIMFTLNSEQRLNFYPEYWAFNIIIYDMFLLLLVVMNVVTMGFMISVLSFSRGFQDCSIVFNYSKKHPSALPKPNIRLNHSHCHQCYQGLHNYHIAGVIFVSSAAWKEVTNNQTLIIYCFASLFMKANK